MAADTHRDAPRLPADIDLQDARLIDRLQRSVPLTERPFADLGAELGLSEAAVLDRLTQLLGSGVLTRLGPLYQIERAGGQFILAALQVPQQRYAEVTAQVNALPEVAHNYRREHALNMWFVVAAETPAVAWATCDQIEAATGLPVHAFPKEREYFVGLYLPLLDRPDPAPPAAQAAPAATALVLTEFDRALIAATQSGLPLVPRPYDAVAAMLGSSSAAVRERLAALLAAHRRDVPNHYRLGYTANGMSVWDVDDAEVDRLGELLGSQPGVSHCYRRPRKPGVWRYNLFAMLHGHSREQVLAQAEQVAALLGPACRAHDVLFSSAILKKTGLRLRQNV